MSAVAFAERGPALLDSGRTDLQSSAGSLRIVRGRLSQHPIYLALTDRSQAGGAFGVAESAGLQELLARARVDQHAVVLVLESGGARLDEGLPALGAFRRLFAAALDARLAGVKLIAVVYGDCFGGASMLVCACQERIGVAGARLGLSGPAIIEALGGEEELDASDREAIRRLLGVEQRFAFQILSRLCSDDVDALHASLAQAMLTEQASAPDLRQQHERLRQRLTGAGIVLAAPADPWIGFVGGQPVGARDCWLAADWLLDHCPAGNLTLALDARGQATTRLDELLGLSEYVVHLALCLMRLKVQGARLQLMITGEASGAIYVALAATASVVIARADARVRLLPPKAVARVLGSAPPDEGLARARECGVVDEILEA